MTAPMLSEAQLIRAIKEHIAKGDQLKAKSGNITFLPASI